MSDEQPKPFVTVPQLARELGVSKGKIMGWILRGEIDRTLVHNVAATTSGRWQLRIAREAVTKFLAGRALLPLVERVRRRRARKGVIQFY